MSTKNETRTSEIWDRTVSEASKRSFHNVDRINDAFNKLLHDGFAPSTTIWVASVLQYSKFDVTDPKNRENSAEYAQFCLQDCYGVHSSLVKRIYTLILSLSKLSLPKNSEIEEIKIMHDLRMFQFTESWITFMKSRGALQKEFKQLSNIQFMRHQHALMKFLLSRKTVFSLTTLEHEYSKTARDTMIKYHAFLENEIRNNEAQLVFDNPSD